MLLNFLKIPDRLPRLLFLLLAAGWLASCQGNREGEERNASAGEPEETPIDFQEFYLDFHTDSAYQMEHILFPLDGLPAADTATDRSGNFKWQKENWKLHSLDHFDPQTFTVERDITDSTLVTEYIRDKATGFAIKRRFAKFDDQWFLIYYAAMNPRAPE